MKRHIRNVHDEMDETYQCPFYSAGRARKKDWIRDHVMRHHKDGWIKCSSDESLMKEVSREEPLFKNIREQLDDDIDINPGL